MTRKPQPQKRKREDSPEDISKTRQKRIKVSKSTQPALSNFASADSSKAWMHGLSDEDDIAEVHAHAACGFGPLGHKQCCPNKFSRTALKPIGDGTKVESEVINISDSEEEVQHVCSQARCKANPYCLNFLGQEKWENPSSGMKVIRGVMDAKGGNPAHLLRKADAPVGLRNLGATCYANAFIQVWNQQDAFRSAVFECAPPVSEAQSLENSPIFQLQVTFAALNYGNAATFDPTPLIESLRLNRGEQQDAQEFAKLFLSHLSEQFAKQSAPHLKNIIASQFEGLSVYGTICHGCRYKSAQQTRFLEIEISLMGTQNKSTLEDCLQETLESEVLTGDNRYRCPQCDSLQDATRYSQIRELPPILHFSVQRFVFDLKTLSRKKSKNLIKYPLTIDMARWKAREPTYLQTESAAEDLYDLCGVLIHKGSSAYSGHYESQVLDMRKQKWYQFNDEVVTELTRTDNQKSDFSSKDCYCLIYTRRRSESMSQDSYNPSEEVKLKIGAQDCALLEKETAFKEELKARTENYEIMRQQKSGIYRNWNLASNTETFKIVAREALLDLMRRGFPEESEKQATNESVPDVKDQATVIQLQRGGAGDPNPENADFFEPKKTQVTNASLSLDTVVCEHGKLDPRRASHLKLITPSSFDSIVEIYPELKHFDDFQEICVACTRDMFVEYRYRESHINALRQFEGVMENSGVLDEGEQISYWISKKWLKDWRLQRPKMHVVGRYDPGPDEESFRLDVYCEHDGLNLDAALRVTVPREAYVIIKQLFPSWSTFSTDNEGCVICAERLETNAQDRLSSIKDAEIERVVLKSILSSNPLTAERSLAPGVSYAVVPSDWVRSWRMWVNKPRNYDRPGAPDNSLFVCRHGNLLFNPITPSELADPRFCITPDNVWEEISDLYPNSGPPILLNQVEGLEVNCNVKVCPDCYTPPIAEVDAIKLSIQLLQSHDPPPSLETHAAAKELISGSKNLFPLFSSASRRPRRVKHGGLSGRFLSLRLARTSTVLDLKTQVEGIEKTPCFYQAVYYKGQELTESTVQLQDIGLEPQDVLQWKSLAESGLPETIEDESDVEFLEVTSTKAPTRVEARAFQGTVLAGL